MPPDHQAALSVLHRLRGNLIFNFLLANVNDFSSLDSDPDVVEDAVKYIIFLVNADQLFDTALGMYDFSLVLIIARHAQKVDNSFFFFGDEADLREIAFRIRENIFRSSGS